MSDEDQELGVTQSKAGNTGEWYAEVVQKAELADYAPMGGFIVMRPWGYAIWELLQSNLDEWFKDTGVQNAYFPLFIPEGMLEKEADIIEGFDPEVAWVTQGGTEELEERLAVRPTSESIITPYMAQWVRSHRDLPLRLNQWCSVVRWEATETKPFLRTREFLWQEGHSAFADEDDAWEATLLRLDQYADVYEDVLAMPVLKGRKPEHDKFPGAEVTTTVEALMPDGKSIQGGTPHYLGTKFAEAFDVTYTDENEEEQYAHTTSFGLSWRALGALVMAHGDDQGLILPPPVAPKQVVVVPIWTGENKAEVLDYAESVAEDLDDAGFRVELDDREERSPGFKYNEWELKGVPLRIEVGGNEVEGEDATLVHRPDNEQVTVDREGLDDAVAEHLDVIYEKLYDDAAERHEEGLHEAHGPEEILGTLGKHRGWVKTAWCGDEACETAIKEKIAAEIVMVDLDEDAEPIEETCGVCEEPATENAYFAKTH